VLVAGSRILLAYLIFYAALGAVYPYIPVYYRGLGLTLGEIGLLFAFQAATQLVFAPIWGGLSDRFPRSRATLPIAAVVATIGAMGLYLAMGFGAVVVATLILYIGVAGVYPILDARTLETLGPKARHRFGQVRAFGSLAFVIATLFVGVLLDRYGPRSLFWVYIPMLALTVVVTATIPRRGHNRAVSLRRGAREILGVPRVPLFLAGFVVAWTALAGTNTFYSIQLIAIGGSGALVGLAWAIGAMVEVPIMYGFPRLAGRFGAERLLVVGGLAFALRSLLAALATDPVMLVAIAPLEGIGFAGTFVGGVTVLAARTPAGTGGTAQGLLIGSAGLATIVGSTLGGVIAAAIGIPGLFAISAAVSILGSAIVAVAIARPAHRAVSPAS
jgi:MFS transporter, PPP family, 3-phenylpropionic acid transporter